jgi:alpha-glucosidase
VGEDDEWWRGAVIYQIYPRSFMDADGDGVGDLKGVLGKLDYVAALGVDGIWLSPFFTSPMKDFGYDVSDYCAVDPLFGTLADFDAVVAKAHALGLKIIIDQVWSHTSDQHPWFKESAASREGPKADWYVWADAKADGTAPNNWMASFGGTSWSWSPRRRQYYLHNFLEAQPDLNFWNPDVQEAILDVARFWLNRGVDGFRLDVINYIFHGRDLLDNPVAPHDRPPPMPGLFQRHVEDRSRPEALAFLARLRALMDSYGARMTVGEVYDEPPLPRQKEYVAGHDRLHTAYGFFLLNAGRATPDLFAQTIISWGEADGWPSWSLGNHDVPRFASRMAGDDPARVRLLTAVLLCLRGTIFLYQGEELGLPQAKVPFERLRDPFAIAAWTGDAGRDGARTPMPWMSAAPNGGFSTAYETWLPVDERHLRLAADVQEADPASTLHFTRRIIATRHSLPALRLGSAKVMAAPAGLFAFERLHDRERLVCVFDFSGDGAEFPLPGAGEIVLSATGAEQIDGDRLGLPRFGGAVVRLNSERDFQ